MTAKRKALLLDLTGAGVSFLAPTVAAVVEFPRAEEALQASGGGLAGLLRMSSAAFAVALVLLLLTCWRFVAHRLKLPRSGFILSGALFLLAHGVEPLIHSFKIIMFWSMLGCGVATVLYALSDRLKREV
ncbi:MAG: hypothetical protein E7663_03205 [Ruminococcaceae bacterium]|nr:hypothetical protein [Oscillospiraceae bacterium]